VINDEITKKYADEALKAEKNCSNETMKHLMLTKN
jgi:hypothetical protein